jgi:hypothetical protein
MFSPSLELAQWAGPITGIAATMLVLFAGYVVAGSKSGRVRPPASKRVGSTTTRKHWRPSVPHTGKLPSDLEYQVEFTWK